MGNIKTTISILIIAAFIALVGCSQGNSSETAKQPAPTEAKKEEKVEKKLKFPEKPINFIVPWSAGGSTDVVARAMADVAQTHLGQSLVIVNRDGAGGTIGTLEGAKAKPDGYTVTISSAAVFTTQPLLKEVQYKLEDFKAIAGVNYQPLVLVVNGSSPYNTVKDLEEAAKKSTNPTKFGHPGAGSFADLAQGAFFNSIGVKASGVAFKGNNPIITALLGGHIDVGAVHPEEVIQHAKDKKLKILGIFAPKRFETIPDVPTMVEQGYDMGFKDHDFAVWKFLLVPKDTPEEVVNFLTEKFSAMLNDPKFKEYAQKSDLALMPMKGQEILQKLDEEKKVYASIIEKLNMKTK